MGYLNEYFNENREKEKKDISNKYSVLISFFNLEKFSIDLISNSKDKSRYFIKNDYLFFTKPQKKVLKMIQDSSGWKQNIDFNLFLSELKKAKFPLYYRDEKKIEKIFLAEENNEIKISLFKTKKDSFYPIKQNDFIFKFDEKISKKKILFIQNNIFYIKEGFLYKQKIDAFLVPILKRAVKQRYFAHTILSCQKKMTKLLDSEILNINNILISSSKNFNLKTNLEPKFIKTEYNNPKQLFEVFYDSKLKKLEIKPFVDYIFFKSYISDKIKRVYKNKKYIFVYKLDPEKKNENIHICVKDYEIKYTNINKEFEIEFYKNIYSFLDINGFDKNLKLKRTGEKSILSFIDKNWNFYRNFKGQIIYKKDRLNKKKLSFKSDIKISLNQKNNFLDIVTDIFIGKEKYDIDFLESFLESKKDYFYKDNGEIVKIKNKKELERFIYIMRTFRKKNTNSFRADKKNSFFLDNIFLEKDTFNVSKNNIFKKFISDIEEQKKLKDFKIKKKYENVLREYQKEGVKWISFLREYGFSGILADDMGLGKTLQTIVALHMFKKKNKPSIIVCPKTLIQNWKNELEKFSPELNFIESVGTKQERKNKLKKIYEVDIILTSYSSLQKDLELYNLVEFNYMVLDEAQYIKNFRTKNSKVVKEIKADYKLALSGTPIENNLSELWSLFDFLMPGFLGSITDFEKTFNNFEKKEKIDFLKKKISFFVLRREKKQVLKQLPEKIVQNIYVENTDEQKLLYTEILKATKKELFDKIKEDGFKKSYLHILSALTKLRQVCNHPNLVLKEENHFKFSSSKIVIFLNIIKEVISENRKVLVFSQFTKMLDILSDTLDKNNIKYLKMTGSSKNRNEIIKNFTTNNDKKVFLISLKVGGLGLNLTAADTVILFDPWWNIAVEKQAEDRVYRIGQKNKVNIYKLITKNTVEEKILKLQDKKSFLFNSVFKENSVFSKKINIDELKDIFS